MTKAKPATPRLWRTNLDYEGFEEYYKTNPDKKPDAIFIIDDDYGLSNEDVQVGEFLNTYIEKNLKETVQLNCGKIILF